MDNNEQSINESSPTSDIKPIEPQVGFLQPLNYATFTQRFIATLIDSSLLVCGLTLMSYFGIKSEFANGLLSLVFFGYMAYMTYDSGATLGKKVMKIRVQDLETGANLTIGKAILRESVGKWLSNIVLSLGYYWMLWDQNKQTWHDKMAKSVVVKV